MANNLQAPFLIHKGQKKKGSTIFWQLPQDLMTIVFNELDTRCGAQIKLMCLLLGTCGNGTFAVSEKFVMDTCGITEAGYKAARKALVAKGWLTHDKENHKLIVNIETIYNSYKSNGVCSVIPNEVCSVIPDEVCSIIPKGITELTYNKEDIEINKENNRETVSILELLSKGVDEERLSTAKTTQERMRAMGF